MPGDLSSATKPSRTTPPAADDAGGGESTETNLIDRLQNELQAKDREVRDLRDQLRAIHTSDGWAILRTLAQVRETVAPHGTRRDWLARLGIRGLRRFKKGIVRLSQVTRAVSRWISQGEDRTIRIEPATRDNYAVVCLPMIEWDFRFQRPQQLMRQFARTRHLVLYAANRFHRGAGARMRPVETNILEISLPGDPAANIYQMLPSGPDRDRMVNALSRLGAELDLGDAVVIAQHPYWTALAEALRERFGWPVVYDCMDDHTGFLHNGPDLLQTESRLVATADLVVVSSAPLYEGVRSRARAAILIRNACEYEHFSTNTSGPPRHRETPRVGYFGAIAEWFDSGLVGELAGLRRDWQIELIGSTLAGDVRALRDASNIRLLGERLYVELPGLIAEWDVFIIPFKRVPLTEATNPVKVYEMLATGKPVVAVALPELIPIAQKGLIRLAGTALEFASMIELELREEDPAMAERRRSFARRNTWPARHLELAAAIEEVRRRRWTGKPRGGENRGVVARLAG